MVRQLRAAVTSFGLLTLVTGVAYPLVVTGVARAAFRSQSEGSLVTVGDKVVGSRLLGQPFEGPRYFWGRLSATSPFPYNAGSSSASNLGPDNPALVDAAKARMKSLAEADPDNRASVPVNLVTASGSGLDPDISASAAYYQVARVARARGLAEGSVRSTVDALVELPVLGVLGEARVNVLRLNLALDSAK